MSWNVMFSQLGYQDMALWENRWANEILNWKERDKKKTGKVCKEYCVLKISEGIDWGVWQKESLK